MWILKQNRNQAVSAITQDRDTINALIKNLPDNRVKGTSLTMHYPPRFPFFLMLLEKEGEFTTSSFDKLPALKSLQEEYDSGTVYYITHAFINKDYENGLDQFEQETFTKESVPNEAWFNEKRLIEVVPFKHEEASSLPKPKKLKKLTKQDKLNAVPMEEAVVNMSPTEEDTAHEKITVTEDGKPVKLKRAAKRKEGKKKKKV